MIPPVYCGSKAVPGCTWAWTLLPNFFLLEWHVSPRLSILLHCVSDSQSFISTWTLFVCLFLSSGVMKTTVYSISQYRDLIGISTSTHLKRKSWSPVRHTPVFHALFPRGTFHTAAYFRNTLFTLYLIHHHLLLIFFCFLSVAILIISCSYVLWTLNLWTVSHYW